MLRAAVAVIALALTACAAQPPAAPVPGIERTVLQRFDLDATREIIVALVTIAPGASAGRHRHPGVETGYALEGTSVLEIDGESPRTLKAGDSYAIPAGRYHDAKAIGVGPAKVLATFIVEKGKPLAEK